jgi:HSP20 family molecular chaperone IbpA
MTLIDEINRLFDELVRDPWSRPRRTRLNEPATNETYLDLEMPFAGGQLGDVSVALQGRQLVVRAGRVPVGSTAGYDASGAPPAFERSFVLPAGAAVTAIEARLRDDVLRVRVGLRGEGS